MLDDWLGKKGHFEGSVGKMAVILSLPKRDENSWDVAALLIMLADGKRIKMKKGTFS